MDFVVYYKTFMDLEISLCVLRVTIGAGNSFGLNITPAFVRTNPKFLILVGTKKMPIFGDYYLTESLVKVVHRGLQH